jgi:hypothetical protein
MKTCTKCGVEQPLENFYRAAGTRDGLRGDCKSCFRRRAKERYPLVREQAIERARKWREDNIDRFRENQRRARSTPEGKRRARDYHLGKKYGITQAEYEAMLGAQGGVCAICGRPPREDISLHVDHDHESGAIRGLTCFRCNNALGDFNDDPALLRSALAYLDDHDPTVQEERALVKARAQELKLSRL